MSKIGNNPIQIEDGTTVEIVDNSVVVRGTKGELSIEIPKGLTVEIEDNMVKVSRMTEKKHHKSIHGLTRSLIQNAVTGVQKPWEKHLEVVGTGYRVKQQGQALVFEVGYSHSVTFDKVDGVEYKVEGNKFTVSGIDKQFVGEIANKIKNIKKPDPYKGKGIRYEGEVLHLKPGKRAQSAGA